ncbi:hypothetical protein HPB51_016167 [Rhipicephalus microplus]|uniref:Tick transposon n=1 Tax=Rhipicephalus microplus TaxID=6941 RepID=A0A9J6E2U4_RHIMP|nr:hypothetical protein HPB51_016167 [Rhipicephalus microplus]
MTPLPDWGSKHLAHVAARPPRNDHCRQRNSLKSRPAPAQRRGPEAHGDWKRHRETLRGPAATTQHPSATQRRATGRKSESAGRDSRHVRATSAEQTGEAAIALALNGTPEVTTILSDSLTAIANFGRGSIGTPAAGLLPRSKSTTTHLRWFLAHVGAIPGGAANRNERADAVARELAHRAAPPPPRAPRTRKKPNPRTGTHYSTTAAYFNGTERAVERFPGLTRGWGSANGSS